MMLDLKDREWSEFTIGNLFTIKSVRGLPMEKYRAGKRPYISTSTVNNGLIDFVAADTNAISDKNCISIDPIKGKAFYHEFEFVGRGFSGASINLLYSPKLNRYNALFICSAIEKTTAVKASYGNLFNSNRLLNGKFFLPAIIRQKSKYAYGYKFNEERMNRQSILLPIDSGGAPDWDYMEQYAQTLMADRLQAYLDHINKKNGDY